MSNYGRPEWTNRVLKCKIFDKYAVIDIEAGIVVYSLVGGLEKWAREETNEGCKFQKRVYGERNEIFIRVQQFNELRNIYFNSINNER